MQAMPLLAGEYSKFIKASEHGQVLITWKMTFINSAVHNVLPQDHSISIIEV